LVTAETVAGDEKLEYVYDYRGRRVSKKVSTGSGGIYTLASHQVFVYDGWNMVAVLDAKTTPAAPVLDKIYTWGTDLSGSMQGAGGVGGLLAAEEKTGSYIDTYSFLYDANGNVTQVIDDGTTAGIAAHYEYTPFGQAAISSSPDGSGYDAGNAYRFSTKVADAETETLYYGYRSYDSKLGRWLNRDPIGEQGSFNQYAMVGNNAINRFDYLGLRDPTAGEKAVIDGLAKAATEVSDPALKDALPKVKAEIEAKIRALPESNQGDKNHRAVIAALRRLFKPTPNVADAYKEWSVREKQHGDNANKYQCSRFIRAVVQEVENKKFIKQPEAASFVNSTDERFKSDTGIELPTAPSAGYGTITAGGSDGTFGQNSAHVVLDLGNGLVVGHHPGQISDEYRRTVKVKDHETSAEIEVSYDITIRKADRMNKKSKIITRTFTP